jgi:hypothetical protein
MTKSYPSSLKNTKNQKELKNQPRLSVLNFIMSYSTSVETLKSQKMSILVQNN